MSKHDRGIVIAPEQHKDPGSRMVLPDVEHPGFDEDGDPIVPTRRAIVAGPNGHSATNPETGVTAVWIPGEIVADWAAGSIE